MISKDLICIVCPNGCRLHGEIDDAGNLNVTGNRCVRGKSFAGTEMTNPTRSLTTTVRTAFEAMPWLPVRTLGEIPKGRIPDAISELAAIEVSSKVMCGDVIAENLAGTGVDVIATMDII